MQIYHLRVFRKQIREKKNGSRSINRQKKKKKETKIH